MFQNNNKAIVKKLTKRTLRTDKKRNFFIITAIALTALLIGSVFNIGMSLVESVKMNQIRLAGTVAHAAVGHPTASQIEQLNALDYVKVVGTGNSVGVVKNTPEMGKISLTLHYFDKTEWEKLRSPAYVDIEGNYPEKENEIMVSLSVLKRLGIDTPYIGMEIPLTYYTDSENKDALISERFRLSGWFTSYGFVQSMNTADVMLVSRELSQKYGKTVEKDGSATLMFDNESRVSEYCGALVSDLGLSENQPVIAVEMYDTNTGQSTTTLIALCAIVVFLIFTGYLLIYNVLYISVSRDVRFYGLLKTLGTTPKQIKRIVIGQVLRLCLIGIPIGIILSLLLSLAFVPFFISELGAVSTEAVVSFSPFIYLGAVVFPLLTAILGASKPAKKAAGISPIEAQRYTGVEVKTKNTRSSAHGKPYKMAFRNIFRDKKRAGVVLLSLFLGITTFLTVTTLVFSMNIAKYIESTFESDFVLESSAWPTQKFDNAFMERLESLPGFERLGVTTRADMSLDYSPEVFGEYIADFSTREDMDGWTEEDIYENFRGFILGVDGEMLIKLNKRLDKPIDVNAFERGEIALIATDKPDLFSRAYELVISPRNQGKAIFDKKIKIPLGGFVPFDYSKGVGSGLAPTVLISNALMREWFSEPIVSKINLDVSSDYEQNALIALKQIIGSDFEISLTSKMEAMEELNGAKMVLFVLGGSVALVIALIGILNFVNVMSVSIMVRKRELATLESIGMSRKQIRKLLICEGLVYAVITLIFVLSVGNAVTYGIFKLFQQQASYAVFTYPYIPALITILVIMAVCLITPERIYRSINRATIVERLREME
ncbi:MAG: ABC transporter permease [Ruminiclostridium sp.]